MSDLGQELSEHYAGPQAEDRGRESFDELFCSLLPRLHRRAVLLIGEGRGEDVVHEAYLRLARKPERLLSHPEPYGYVFRTMVNLMRSQWRSSRHELVSEGLPEGAADDRDIEQCEALWECKRLMARLSRRQAAAVLLVDLDGCTIDEAAAIMGVHRGTVARLRGRALERMRGDLLINAQRRRAR